MIQTVILLIAIRLIVYTPMAQQKFDVVL